MTMPVRKVLMAVEQTLFKARSCARELNAADDVFFRYIHRYGMKLVLSDDTEESLFDLFLSMECRDSNGVPRYPCRLRPCCNSLLPLSSPRIGGSRCQIRPSLW